jgi:hypothetical protein
MTEFGAGDGVAGGGELGRDATGLAAGSRLAAARSGRAAGAGLSGLAAWRGAITVTSGSEVTAPVAVCAIAVPPGPHSNAVDRSATKKSATTLDDGLMTMPPQAGTDHAFPLRTPYHTNRRGFSGFAAGTKR